MIILDIPTKSALSELILLLFKLAAYDIDEAADLLLFMRGDSLFMFVEGVFVVKLLKLSIIYRLSEGIQLLFIVIPAYL
jgi:hypothetical protein